LLPQLSPAGSSDAQCSPYFVPSICRKGLVKLYHSETHKPASGSDAFFFADFNGISKNGTQDA
jgi:hypothetical protein